MGIADEIDIIIEKSFDILEETEEVQGSMFAVKYLTEKKDEQYKMKISMSYEDFSEFIIYFMKTECELDLVKYISLELAKHIISKEVQKLETLTDPNFSDLCKMVKL